MLCCVCVCANRYMHNTIKINNKYTRIYVRISILRCLYNTVWPEILAGIYFGGLLKICHLAEFTLVVEPVLAIMIFIAKWLYNRTLWESNIAVS